jgi:CHRD domain
MRKIMLTSLALAAGALVAVGSALGAPSNTPKTFTVHMTGGQEVPKGSPIGTGTFRYQLIPSRGQVCFSLTWSKIGTALSSHIHKAAKGKSGSVVIPLSGVAPVAHSGCRNAAKSLINAIQAHPSRYYVNVHTAKYPSGAIRGQL